MAADLAAIKDAFLPLAVVLPGPAPTRPPDKDTESDA